MARLARDELELDTVLFMPAYSPPHKDDENVLDFDTRVAMLRLATKDEPSVQVSLMEAERSGPSFTVDLLSAYRADHADDIYFIVGADSLRDLPTWKNPNDVMRLATLVVFPRDEIGLRLPVPGPASVVVIEQSVPAVSSTDIRKRAVAGETLDGMVAPGVADFIRAHHVYGGG